MEGGKKFRDSSAVFPSNVEQGGKGTSSSGWKGEGWGEEKAGGKKESLAVVVTKVRWWEFVSDKSPPPWNELGRSQEMEMKN